MRTILFALAATIATPVFADVDTVVDQKILPDFANFATSARAMADAAAEDCTPGAVVPHYQATFDAWMKVQHLRVGPTEEGALHVAFWPDDRGFVPKTLSGLIADEDPVINDAEDFATVSIAGRGLFALDMLLYDERFDTYGADSYTCDLVAAIALDLATEAERQSTAWAEDYAPILKGDAPKADGKTMTEMDGFQVLYTQIISGIETLENVRIDRPLGEFDRPRPTRAEAWRSGRPLRNIDISLNAMVADALLLMGSDLPQTFGYLETAQATLEKISDPTLASIEEDSGEWLKLQILRDNVVNVKTAIEVEIGSVLGIEAGFNSADGD
ncbi:imelysin family protein [Marivivens donghaensis]|uniref:Imelysin family protein n=1 Tax=Marivivens donghaensis TaxID=1699413 RepID=A0ABX0VUY5_9RHOB|nr:imelysin family protein [Marivivens donghaensis]NIY71403.1 imelysin family protein [Marivivens donghaensis]